MLNYEENWETGVLVTAEAVFGVGLPQGTKPGVDAAPPDEAEAGTAMAEAAD